VVDIAKINKHPLFSFMGTLENQKPAKDWRNIQTALNLKKIISYFCAIF
jgi:hypothetical protein